MSTVVHGYRGNTRKPIWPIYETIIKNLEGTIRSYEVRGDTDGVRYHTGYLAYIKEKADKLANPSKNAGMSRKQLKRIKREEARKARYEND